MKKKVRHVSVLVLCTVLLLCSGIKGSAFVLIGPNAPVGFVPANYYSFANANGFPQQLTVTPPGGDVSQGFLNHTDPMGWPVPVKEFYRWNWPELSYAFDSTFIRYFGHNGMQAVQNAFEVLNDYFEPQDGSYSGVSSLDLVREYDKHFSTWKYNPSANAGNVYDMETIVLGLLVNHLGLGNPHRHCYTIRDIIGYNVDAFGSVGNFQVALRNYDPYTYHPTPIINGVTYSYFIFSDPEYDARDPNNLIFPAVFDAVEYSISNHHGQSAVAGIRDVINFGGLPWPIAQPTVYRSPGVFFAPDDPLNSPIPENVTRSLRTQPRHTLTFDDAGGLRYLYRTNNIVYETYDASVQLIEVANMNPPSAATAPGAPANSPFVSPSARTIATMGSQGITPLAMPPAFRAQLTPINSIVRGALRGGVDKIQFKYMSYDSLLNLTYHTNVSVWKDVFITNALPTDVAPAVPPYFSQLLARVSTIPDIVFIAADLQVGGNTLPVIQIPAPGTDWDGTMIANNSQQGVIGSLLGPGVILPPFNGNQQQSIQYHFTTRAPLTTVIWTGEPGLEGNFITQFQWGWITNTGPNDYIGFPKVDITQVEAITGPSGTVPEITHITVYDALNEGYRTPAWDMDRSRDTVTIYGQRLDSVTTINILDSEKTADGVYPVLQKIDARRYIMSDQQIVLPPGTLGDDAVSLSGDISYRKVSLTNSQGESNAELIYEISDGRSIILNTQYDGLPLNTTKSLIIQGSGFKSIEGDVNQIWFFDESNTSNYQIDPNSGTGEFPIPIAVLDINSSNVAYTADSGVPVNYSEIVVTDTMIYLPPNLLSDGNYTNFTRPVSNDDSIGFGEMGETSLGRIMARSEGNSSSIAEDMFTRHIRLAHNPDPSGVPNANANLSEYRTQVQGFTHIGVGGDRNHTISGHYETLPRITDVFTDHNSPASLSRVDANRTWVRGNATDVLVIRGIGLDLALSLEFVDGLGNPIMSTDGNGLPPPPISLRGVLQGSERAPGVTIVDYPPLGRDGYEIRIDPIQFGMNGNELFDSLGGTNISQTRRVVIRTPFGVTIASPLKALVIQP